jgi:hypothetical protein
MESPTTTMARCGRRNRCKISRLETGHEQSSGRIVIQLDPARTNSAIANWPDILPNRCIGAHLIDRVGQSANLACFGVISTGTARSTRSLAAANTQSRTVSPSFIKQWQHAVAEIGDILAHERGGLKLCPRSLLCFLGPPVALLTSCRLPLRGWLSANRNFS